MGMLRDRMEQDLRRNGPAPTTRRNSLLYCRKFAAPFGRSSEGPRQAVIRDSTLDGLPLPKLTAER